MARQSNNPNRSTPQAGWYRYALARGLVAPSPSLAAIARGNAFYKPFTNAGSAADPHPAPRLAPATETDTAPASCGISQARGKLMSETKIATRPDRPEGMELRGNLSFARLNPTAGALARDTRQPQLCGWIVGNAYAVQDSDPEVDRELYGKFRRIIGDFIALPPNRSQEITATECFLPRIAERFIQAALDKGATAVPVRYEGWAFPYPSGLGYHYRVFVRQAPGVMSTARRMAIECGIIDAPLVPPPQPIDYDPETGEFDVAAEPLETSTEPAQSRKAKAAA